jgi:hypothetical protein
MKLSRVKTIHHQQQMNKICVGSMSGMVWTGKTKVLGEKPVPMPLCLPQIQLELASDRNQTCTVKGCQLTA